MYYPCNQLYHPCYKLYYPHCQLYYPSNQLYYPCNQLYPDYSWNRLWYPGNLLYYPCNINKPKIQYITFNVLLMNRKQTNGVKSFLIITITSKEIMSLLKSLRLIVNIYTKWLLSERVNKQLEILGDIFPKLSPP